MNLALLFALVLGNGATPHFATLTWPAITVTDSNADGSSFTRPALGYYVYRAPMVAGVAGAYELLNPDEIVMGMLDGDGAPADGWFEDTAAVEGVTYVYAVSAVDLGGESGKSPVSNVVTVPQNPNPPGNFQAATK